jgi:predicted nucleotidyltransferase
VDAYLSQATALIDGLYLFGSIALDDFHPGRSDIDFVAVTADRLDAEEPASTLGRPGRARPP